MATSEPLLSLSRPRASSVGMTPSIAEVQPKSLSRVHTTTGKEAARRNSVIGMWQVPEVSPTEDAILDLALGSEQMPKLNRRLSCRMSACRLFSRGPMDAQHGQRRKANVVRVNRKLSLFLEDFYHLILDLPSSRFMCLFFVAYILSFVGFACIYRLASTHCDLDCRTFSDALFLSVETMMTIGYGVPDPFFKGCPWIVAIIIAQCFLGALLDSSLLGIIYQRISAGGRRSATIVFSDKAVIRTVGDAHYFMFQICEMRASQLLECHVRLYLYTRPSEGMKQSRDTPIEMVPMRLEQPDDSLGASLLLAVPTAIVHRIDEWSPLRGAGCVQGSAAPPPLGHPSPFVPAQRTSEADAGCRNTVWCEACGECFARSEQLRRHVEYSARRSGGADEAHAALLERLPGDPSAHEVRKQIRSLLSSRFIEVVVVIDGIDPVTSSNVQARHSYIANDIAWDAQFANCIEDTVLPSGETGLLIDFERFHELIRPKKSPRV